MFADLSKSLNEASWVKFWNKLGEILELGYERTAHTAAADPASALV